MARENRLWEWMRDGLKGTKGLHMVRVENLVNTGDPDVEGCYQGHYFEVELKGCDRPKRGGKLGFEVRTSQTLYHRKRWRCGGNTWIYIRVGANKEVARYLIPGGLVETVDWPNVTESQLLGLCVLPPQHTPLELLTKIKTRAPFPSD